MTLSGSVHTKIISLVLKDIKGKTNTWLIKLFISVFYWNTAQRKWTVYKWSLYMNTKDTKLTMYVWFYITIWLFLLQILKLNFWSRFFTPQPAPASLKHLSFVWLKDSGIECGQYSGQEILTSALRWRQIRTSRSTLSISPSDNIRNRAVL